MPKADYDSVGKPLIIFQDQVQSNPDFDRTVPDGKIWRIQSIWVSYATTAVVGNRRIELNMEDPNDSTILLRDAAVTQPASITATYIWAPHNPQELAFTVGQQSTRVLLQTLPVFPMSVSPIVAGRAARIRIRDFQFIDGNDVMAVIMDIREYDGPDPLSS